MYVCVCIYIYIYIYSFTGAPRVVRLHLVILGCSSGLLCHLLPFLLRVIGSLVKHLCNRANPTLSHWCVPLRHKNKYRSLESPLTANITSNLSKNKCSSCSCLCGCFLPYRCHQGQAIRARRHVRGPGGRAARTCATACVRSKLTARGAKRTKQRL